MAVRNIVTKIKLNKPYNSSNLNQEYVGEITYSLYDTRNGKKVGKSYKTKAPIIILRKSRYTKTDTMRLNIPSNEGGTNDVMIKWKKDSDTPEYIKTYLGLSNKQISNVIDNDKPEIIFTRDINNITNSEFIIDSINKYIKEYM